MKTKLLFLAFSLIITVAFGQISLDYDVTQTYNSGAGQYENSGKNEYQYDSNGNLKELLNLGWDGNSSWTNNNKEIHNYDGNNNRTEIIASYHDGSNWINSYKTDYTYNGSNQLTGYIGYNWNGANWVLSNKLDITYQSGELVGGIFYERSGSFWVELEKASMYFIGSDISEIIYDDWNGSSWDLDSRDTYTLTSGNITQILFEVWRGAWENEEKQDFILDANSNRTSLTESSYNLGSWSVYNVTSNTFDSAELMSSIYHPFYDINYDLGLEDFPYIHRVVTSSENAGNQLTTYFYSDQTASVSDVNIIEVKIYPNPTSSALTINLPNTHSEYTIDIFNILGNIIVSKTMSGSNNKLNIEHLNTGIYYVKINTSKGSISKRIVKI